MHSVRGFLLSSTVLAGVAAVSLSATSAWGQTQPTPNAPVAAGTVAQPPVTEPELPQDPAGEPGSTEVDAVVVTGSRIRRNPANSPTPLIQLNREEILLSGEPNVVDFLADIPALQNSIVPEDTTGAGLGDGGLSLLNLRNLGVDRTLVLVDGRRHVGASQGSAAVDIDNIPSLLIQNVEIISGGASALYGADAVSGVVNFILRRNFDGIELDAAYGQINQDGQYNYQLQGLVGRNFFDERLNVYAYLGYQESEEVTDSDIDYLRGGRAQFQNDLDPTTSPSDGVLDVLQGTGFGSIARIPGGSVTLSRSTRPSPLSDPDIPATPCNFGAGENNATAFTFSGNCFVQDPGFSFAFNSTGGIRPLDFGTFRPEAGLNRTTVRGSADALPLTAFQDSRLPAVDATRFQTGLNFRLTPEIQLFGEFKFVEESSFDNFQPAFFNIGITPAQNNRDTGTGLSALNVFSIGTDNAFLDPALRALIEGNRRQNFNLTATSPLFGQPTGATILDQRALLLNFATDLGGRSQLNEREVLRYVVGVRGERERLSFINNLAYEIGYTYGRSEDTNLEGDVVDAENYAFAADAVRNAAGQIVCRVQDRAARGLPNTRAADGSDLAPNDPRVTGCVPIRVFGSGGISSAALSYILTSQNTFNRNEQSDLLAFASGELWDFWGAGPIGIAAGYEYREETTSAEFNSPSETDPTGGLLFANALADFPEASFDVSEVFVEARLPILRDLPLAQTLEVSGTFRRSDYSTIGESDTYSLQALYRPVQDLLFRATYGESVRAPNLSEVLSPLSQNFGQLTDGCSSLVINTTGDARIRNNRIRNCAQIGVPVDFVDPNPNTSNSGFLGGNIDLVEEESKSYTFSVVLTPRFIPNLSVVVDYYSIDITNAIAFLSPQAILNLCTDSDSFNPLACGLVPRNNQFEVEGFVQGPLNFAGLRSRGIDFAATYRVDLPEMFQRDMGALRFNVRGNYLIRRQDFTNPTAPGQATNLDSTVNNPRVRILAGVTYEFDRLALTYEADFQSSQELLDNSLFVTNPDSRPEELFDTQSFTTHDITARYQLRDDVVLRAGVVNVTDEEPNIQSGTADNFDLFGRRFFVGVNFRR